MSTLLQCQRFSGLSFAYCRLGSQSLRYSPTFLWSDTRLVMVIAYICAGKSE